MTISYLIYLIECPSIDGLLDCFCFLAIMTNSAMNIPMTGIAESHGNPMFNLLRNCHTIMASL